MSDARERLLRYLEHRPGACLQDIADHLGVARTSALHHVRVLRRDRQVVTQRKGRRVLHFPTRVGDRVHQSILATWRMRTARAILEQVQDDPRVSWRAIARSLDVTPRAVRWHLQRMEEDGLVTVRRTPDGLHHEVVLHPSVRMMQEVGELENWPPAP